MSIYTAEKPSLTAPVNDAALAVCQLSTTYDGVHLALEDVTFSVQPAERIGLLGPNGAGKSTLFKVLMGLMQPLHGQVWLHGQSVADEAHHVAYVPQFQDVDWKFPVTVRDVVMMGRTRQIGWLHLPQRHDMHHQVVERALAQVELLPLANRQIGELSGGQKRRAFIARALAQEANILLLDEPFAGVDAKAQHTIIRVLDNLRAAKVTVMLATHDLSMASAHFDRLLLLNRSVVAYGTSAEVFKPDLLSRAFGGQLAIWKATDNTADQLMMLTEHCCPE